MGQFRIEIVATGSHGCQRDKGDGDKITVCGDADCIDCITREFVEILRLKSYSVDSATFTHWPGQEGQVVDDLVTKTRHGAFWTRQGRF